MDRRIVLQRKNRTVRASGAEGGSWEAIATVPAAVLPITGRESFAAQQRFAEVDTRFVVRYRKGYTPLERVLFAGRAYSVVAVLEIPGGRPDRLEILATARAE